MFNKQNFNCDTDEKENKNKNNNEEEEEEDREEVKKINETKQNSWSLICLIN